MSDFLGFVAVASVRLWRHQVDTTLRSSIPPKYHRRRLILGRRRLHPIGPSAGASLEPQSSTGTNQTLPVRTTESWRRKFAPGLSPRPRDEMSQCQRSRRCRLAVFVRLGFGVFEGVLRPKCALKFKPPLKWCESARASLQRPEIRRTWSS
jgi:hypothetical protein